ncbi:dipeptide epimerase [Antarcticibacterium sp. 1MA-6-2]|uniref:dipeptide epimerase n=1 Tax=Antarcticibacterium sp. 1MA-6-2 TaxID=2908210 RepID=UPI001F21E021|nr:dipeptide epimerase [Antarcticibacterium sp. 1MA-6-2]UJH90136.1 dipeptide epimerase [Antarcticibacterium sp. 1MA-6-2]
MEITYHSFDLELRNTFTISHGSRDFQPSLIVELNDQGYSGYGEAAAVFYYGITVEKMISDLKQLEPLIKENINLPPEELWDITNIYLKDNSFAQCALDIAANDLFGKKKGLPLYRLWKLDPEKMPLTNYTIGIDTVEKMVQKLKDFPWPLYKIKLGTDDDVAIVRELRKHTDAPFRVDANAGWTVEEAIENSKILKDLNVEFLEQPLPKDDWEGIKEVYKHSALPLIADESCIKESDVARCEGYFHGINIKLTKCGGLTPARRMIKEASQKGMKTMVGCMMESTVGISAIAQLLPLLDYVDMDGALLLKNDIAEGVKLVEGKAILPNENGTGVRLIKN